MSQANSFDCYPSFVIRTPLFSLRYLDNIPEDPEEILEFIKEQWTNPIIKDALLAASPDFVGQFEVELEQDSLSERMTASFLKYFIRMSFRCTPFGLFAGISTGEITTDLNIRINNPDEYLLGGRLDMEFLGAYVQKLMSSPDFMTRLSYTANSSLYKTGQKWRYVEVLFQVGSRKKYRITALDCNEILDYVISASGTFRPWQKIVDQLVNLGYPMEDAAAFVIDLINNQVLIPDVSPNLTGKEFSGKLAARLRTLADKSDIIGDFIELDARIKGVERPGNYSKRQKEVLDNATKIVPGLNHSRLVQFDMLTSFKSRALSREVSNKVLMGIRLLKALSGSRPNMVLERFRKYFTDRFDTREVPLPLVMDSDIGIGLDGPQGQQMNDPGPLLDGLDFPMDIDSGDAGEPHWFLRSKMKAFDSSKSNYIELDKLDIRELKLRKGHFHEQMFAMCNLTGHDGSELTFRLASDGNPSYLMGRFGFLNDKGRLDKHIREMIGDDIRNHPDEILAEIVHLPEDRTGNILQRPSFYNWEITYLANPGGDAGIINPDEILVSVKAEEIILKHRESGMRIIPRLTNAHNYRGRQLPLYQFLCELARQESGTAFYPNWGRLAGLYDRTPGLRYDNIILSPARWRLKLDEKLRNTKGNRLLYKQILEWADKNNLPKKLVWSHGDHELIVDWSNYNVVMAAWESIRKNKYVIFSDYPYATGSPVKGDDGCYANEILFTYKKSGQ